MLGYLLIFTVYLVSAVVALYSTFKILTLYSPVKPPVVEVEHIVTRPGRWRETFSSRAANLGGAIRDATREAIDYVVRVLESENIHSHWLRERRKLLGTLLELLKTLKTLHRRFDLVKSLKITFKMFRFYNFCKLILKSYHLIEEDKKVRSKVDKAVKYILDFKASVKALSTNYN